MHSFRSICLRVNGFLAEIHSDLFFFCVYSRYSFSIYSHSLPYHLSLSLPSSYSEFCEDLYEEKNMRRDPSALAQECSEFRSFLLPFLSKFPVDANVSATENQHQYQMWRENDYTFDLPAPHRHPTPAPLPSMKEQPTCILFQLAFSILKKI